MNRAAKMVRIATADCRLGRIQTSGPAGGTAGVPSSWAVAATTAWSPVVRAAFSFPTPLGRGTGDYMWPYDRRGAAEESLGR